MMPSYDQISSGWHKGIFTLSHPDDLAIGSISSGWLMVNVLCDPDIRNFPKSSGWHNISWTLCHPDEIAPILSISSGWHCRISSGWLTMLPCVIRVRKLIWSLSHPDDLDILNISSGWLIVNVLCHPDDIRSLPKSSGRHNISWTLCHPDEIALGRISSGWPM